MFDSHNPFRKTDSLVDAVRAVLSGQPVEEKMDPVDPKALKGKYKDRKDKDIDNDGDVDSSDEYLHKRRKAISKAMKEGVVLGEAKTDAYHKEMLKALGKSKLPKGHQYTSAVASNGDFVVYDGGKRIVGRLKKGEHSIKEEVELDEATYSYKAATFNGNVVKGTGSTKGAARKDAEDKAKALGSTIRKRLPEEAELDEAFKAGKIQFKDGKYKVIDAKTAEILNNAMNELNTTNRKRMETEAMKDTESFEAMLKFAKAAV